MSYDVLNTDRGLVKMWTQGVPVEDEARDQLRRVADLPFIHKWVAAMPDVHWGRGATVGSVVPTVGAIIPAAVGVDLGCGMMAVQTTLRASDLPDDLAPMRSAIEAAVPHGRTANGNPQRDRGAWRSPPKPIETAWSALGPRLDALAERHPRVGKCNHVQHLGTLGTGNHFIEVCLDEAGAVWFMLHTGSRGLGNRIGSYFIAKAKEEMQRFFIHLPDADLAYLPEGSQWFDDYVEGVQLAQDYARLNRELMMAAVVRAVQDRGQVPPFAADVVAVNCHHNYVAREHHYGRNVWVTRKGAVRAGPEDLGIIPGSMGARSYIVRGKGHPESCHSCRPRAGRAMSRTAARKRFSLADHAAATAHVECRKDADVIDETPAAYKDIDAVMAAQADLVDVVHTLRQVVCVKG